jgi:hypothetical protein
MSIEKIVSELEWVPRVWENKLKAGRDLETANMRLKVKSVPITGTVASIFDVNCISQRSYLPRNSKLVTELQIQIQILEIVLCVFLEGKYPGSSTQVVKKENIA